MKGQPRMKKDGKIKGEPKIKKVYTGKKRGRKPKNYFNNPANLTTDAGNTAVSL